MGRILAIANHKGGVGKTTTTINLGAALQRAHRSVLLVDLDPQANLTYSLGFTEPLMPSVYDALKDEATLRETFRRQFGLTLAPANLDLSAAELELSGVAGRELLLRELLEPVQAVFDYILIDCPPSLGLLTLNAFTAAEGVLIPLQTEYLALQGLTKLAGVIDMVRKRLNAKLQVTGVLPTQFDKRKILHREVVEAIYGHFGEKVFQTAIRDNVALAEAPSSGQDIFTYSDVSNGAQDYAQLAVELQQRLRTTANVS